MTATAEPTTQVGQSRLRKEDARLITGRTKWTDNIDLTGMLHIAMVRSPVAHGRITSIDVSAAKQMPGVVAVYTGADLDAEQSALPCAWPINAEATPPRHVSIAVDKVNFAGEIVAVVVARDVASAKDATEAVEVDYDPIDPVLDLEAAIAEGAAPIHADLGSNRWVTFPFDSVAAGATSGPTADEAIAAAEADPDSVVVKRRWRQNRLIPAFMEPRSVVIDPTGEQMVVYSATQIPHVLRVMLGVVLGLPEHKVRVIAPDVGGGFGGKLQVIPEEILSILVSRRLGKPVKWTETRSESMVSAHHGRDQIQEVTLAAKKDGTFTALKFDITADMGAYFGLFTPAVPVFGAFIGPAIYKIPSYMAVFTDVFTNKTPTDAYRGAGRPEVTFAIERIVDELAVELGRDPLELREQNWIKNTEFPYTNAGGLTYDSGNYEAATAKAVELFDYAGLRREQEERRASGDPVQLGIGISTFTEMCGLAPSRLLGALGAGAGGWEYAAIRMLPTGAVEVVTGSSAHGQGHETAWAQIASDQLGIPFENIEVLHGDTQVAPKGMDTYGSRSLPVGGTAVVKAAQKVVEKAKKVAAHLLEASEDDIDFEKGRFSVRGTDKGITMPEVVFATFLSHNFPEGVEPSLDSDYTFDPENFSFPHGTHLAAIEVDTDTGKVNLRKYVCVDDVGSVVNPLLVEGQIHGGLAQGIAQALYEEANYDEQGTLVNGTFVDYTLPSAADLPSFVTDRTETPATSNPLGVKGVGEAGCIASTPAIVNGVVDAIRHLGVTQVEMPTTSQRVWRALQEAKGRSTQETPVDTHSPGAGLGSIDPNNPQGEVQ
ncbi:xanthine dehydrogenase family protein molybdopterin-binding subunit [Pseudonocardia sp.]|uniref:xanthine dehydrogenase family protein molybdopterin-binding subunit n=1 Tax=Pseudonocardia sp. TaxID=60912 RepID=UPI003D10F10A